VTPGSSTGSRGGKLRYVAIVGVLSHTHSSGMDPSGCGGGPSICLPSTNLSYEHRVNYILISGDMPPSRHPPILRHHSSSSVSPSSSSVSPRPSHNGMDHGCSPKNSTTLSYESSRKESLMYGLDLVIFNPFWFAIRNRSRISCTSPGILAKKSRRRELQRSSHPLSLWKRRKMIGMHGSLLILIK